MSVCVYSRLTFWRTEGIYFKSQKRCFDQPHLAQSWHRDPGEKRNAGGQTSPFLAKMLNQNTPNTSAGVWRWGREQPLLLPAADGPAARTEAQLAK